MYQLPRLYVGRPALSYSVIVKTPMQLFTSPGAGDEVDAMIEVQQ
jgi:hypothetical protein